MSGTISGGKKAAQTNKAKYDEAFKDQGGFYSAIGRLGGAKSRGGGFAKDSVLAREAGRRGGMASRKNLSDNTVPCSYCDGKYKNRSSLLSHVSQYHRGER